MMSWLVGGVIGRTACGVDSQLDHDYPTGMTAFSSGAMSNRRDWDNQVVCNFCASSQMASWMFCKYYLLKQSLPTKTSFLLMPAIKMMCISS
jgi:hypothetical protein